MQNNQASLSNYGLDLQNTSSHDLKNKNIEDLVEATNQLSKLGKNLWNAGFNIHGPYQSRQNMVIIRQNELLSRQNEQIISLLQERQRDV